jgi:hypothetical protein
MTNNRGQLHKMSVKAANPVDYNFSWGEVGLGQKTGLGVNQFLGKKLNLSFSGKINCIACNRAIKKTFQQGYCFPCAKKLAACDMCILKPETCHYQLGTCREPAWGLANCFIPHIVYLANSSGLKVGLTRETQIPTRWLDQGAIQALPILRLKSRYQAGLIESAIANIIADKTDWRKLLVNQAPSLDLAAERDKVFSQLGTKIQEIAGKFKFGDFEILTAEKVQEFQYPIIEYPSKVTALSFDKTAEISGVLNGIKGQYLLLDNGVLNIRKFTGYEIEVRA